MSRTSNGLTLTELIITTALLAILLGAIWFVYDSGFRPYYSQEKRSTVKAEVGRSFENMAQELRQTTGITSATQTGVTFTLDTDDNGVDEDIQYTWSGTAGDALQRIADVTTSPIQWVDSLVFSYYDASNNLLSFPVTASQVRVISVDLTVISQDETFQLRSQTRPRNLS